MLTQECHYRNDYKLSLVKSERYIYLHGVILKMEFLYPSPDDDEQIILLVVLVNKGRTRMLIYEWVTGGKSNFLFLDYAKGSLSQRIVSHNVKQHFNIYLKIRNMGAVRFRPFETSLTRSATLLK